MTVSTVISMKDLIVGAYLFDQEATRSTKLPDNHLVCRNDSIRFLDKIPDRIPSLAGQQAPWNRDRVKQNPRLHACVTSTELQT